MTSKSDLKELVSTRKWFDLTERIKEWCTEADFEANRDYVLDLLSSNMLKIHPISLTSTIAALFYRITPEKARDIIHNVIEMLENNGNTHGNSYFQEVVTLRLYFYIASIQLNNLENVESQILSLRASHLSNENLSMLYIVSALFYEKIGNYEEAQSYLFLHAQQTGTVYDIAKLVELSIRSNVFFDFSAISALDEFKSLPDSSMKNLFMKITEGNVSNINPEEVCALLKTRDANNIITKMHLLNIIRICFKAEKKYVSFAQFSSELNVDGTALIQLLLRALGLKIVRGWIDSERELLYFDSVLPRALTDEELYKMKLKFVEWRKKIQHVIEMVEQK